MLTLILQPKNQVKIHKLTWKFQLEWVCKLPWAEGILKDNGKLHMVRCNMCSTMDRKERVRQPKWGTLKKHEVGGRLLSTCLNVRGRKGSGIWQKNEAHEESSLLQCALP